MTTEQKRRPGRPPKAVGAGAGSCRGVRLYAEDAARLQRLAVRYRMGESELIRHALRELERITKEEK